MFGTVAGTFARTLIRISFSRGSKLTIVGQRGLSL